MISGWIKRIFSVLIAIFYFCCNPSTTDFNNKTRITKNKMTTCNSALEQIKNRDFIAWTGLPANCDWSPLVGDLPTDWSEIPQRSLGSNFLQGKMLMANVEGYMRASFSFIKGTPVLFEAKGPELQTPVLDLIEEFGLPKAKLDWSFGTLPCPESEYVYPTKGITLFLSTDKTRIFHIALYSATSLDNYLENIRPQLGKNRLPKH
jgi:Tfp pilus assembly major pilin PilA